MRLLPLPLFLLNEKVLNKLRIIRLSKLGQFLSMSLACFLSEDARFIWFVFLSFLAQTNFPFLIIERIFPAYTSPQKVQMQTISYDLLTTQGFSLYKKVRKDKAKEAEILECCVFSRLFTQKVKK